MDKSLIDVILKAVLEDKETTQKLVEALAVIGVAEAEAKKEERAYLICRVCRNSSGHTVYHPVMLGSISDPVLGKANTKCEADKRANRYGRCGGSYTVIEVTKTQVSKIEEALKKCCKNITDVVARTVNELSILETNVDKSKLTSSILGSVMASAGGIIGNHIDSEGNIKKGTKVTVK